MAVAAPRGRADRDEYRVGLANRLGEIGREIEPRNDELSAGA